MLMQNRVVEYLALNLIKTYPTDNTTKGFLDKYDFYVFPFVNPDGRCCFKNPP